MPDGFRPPEAGDERISSNESRWSLASHRNTLRFALTSVPTITTPDNQRL
jgi:hypothetical protein